MFRGFVAAAAISSVATFALVSHAALSVAGSPKIVVKGLAKGLGIVKVDFEGTSNDLKAEEKDGKLVLTSSLSKMDWGNRKKHFDEAFPPSKCPDVKLTLPKGELKVDGKSAKGQIAFCGKSSGVTVQYSAAKDGEFIKVNSANFAIEDYVKHVPPKEGEDKPAPISKMSVTVQPKITVSVTGLKFKGD